MSFSAPTPTPNFSQLNSVSALRHRHSIISVGSGVVVTNYGPAVITKMNRDGTYAVTYDTGATYSSVSRSQIVETFQQRQERYQDQASAPANSTTRTRTRTTMAARRATRKTTTRASFLQRSGHRSQSRTKQQMADDLIKFERHQWTRLHQWTVGSRVVVTNYGPAVITKLNKNGTYAVNYDAGGSYSSVCPTQCRRPEDL